MNKSKEQRQEMNNCLIEEIRDGFLAIVADEIGIVSVSLGEEREKLANDIQQRFGVSAEETARASVSSLPSVPSLPALSVGMATLKDYLNGNNDDLSDLKLHITGTDFQQRAWRQIAGIPRGMTLSYEELASALNTHPRAAGGACAANDLAVVIPCHRILPKQKGGGGGQGNPDLGHYRWGTQWKRRLLRLEHSIV